MVPVIKAVVTPMVATVARVTVISATGITDQVDRAVTAAAPLLITNLQVRADHTQHLTVITDPVVTDPAAQVARVVEDQVVARVVTVAADQVVTDQAVVLVTDLPVVVLSVTVITEDLRIRKSTRTKSRTRSRKPWPK